ncbi:SpoIIIAH-like family protein [Caldicellulosiruptoraceae bacterium PP1]
MKYKRIFIKVYNKNQLILIFLVIFLLISGILTSRNFNKKDNGPQVLEVSNQNLTLTKNTSIDDLKLKREIERGKEVDLLIELLKKADNSNKSLIDQKISNIIDLSNKEMIAESLLQSKGYTNCAVYKNNDLVFVVVDKKLSKNDIIIIQNIITNNFKIKFNQIRINSLKD